VVVIYASSQGEGKQERGIRVCVVLQINASWVNDM
jgi:hypothetical protein